MGAPPGFCAHFCWIVGLVGIVFFTMMAIQVKFNNPYLIRTSEDPEVAKNMTPSRLFSHLIYAAVVFQSSPSLKHRCAPSWS